MPSIRTIGFICVARTRGGMKGRRACAASVTTTGCLGSRTGGRIGGRFAAETLATKPAHASTKAVRRVQRERVVRILNISCVPSAGGPRLGCLVPTGAFAGPRLARCVFATLAAGGRGRFITPTLSLPLMSRTARDHAHKFGFVNRKVPVLLPGVPGRGRADLSFRPSAGGWIRRRCSRSDRWPHSAFGSSST